MAVELISSNRFAFKYGGKDYPIKTFSALEVNAKTAGHALPIASGKDALMIRQTVSSGYTSNGRVTIEAAIQDGNLDLWKEFKANLPKSYVVGKEGGDAKWSSSAKEATIGIYDSDNKEVVAYKMTNCHVVGYSVSEFNVDSDQLLMETFEIIYESLERTK